VVDQAQHLVGIVSEGDLLHRVEIGTESRRSWWLDLLSAPEDLARRFVKSHALRVGDIMTKAVRTAAPTTPLEAIATTLEEHGFKRLPVVADGKLVGIVSRADLLRALAVRKLAPSTPDRSDGELRDAVVEALRASWVSGPRPTVIVEQGVVHLWGLVHSAAEQDAMRVAAEEVPGVKAVESHLSLMPHLIYAT
jgi:predicted transcriptional regulator